MYIAAGQTLRGRRFLLSTKSKSCTARGARLEPAAPCTLCTLLMHHFVSISQPCIPTGASFHCTRRMSFLHGILHAGMTNPWLHLSKIVKAIPVQFWHLSGMALHRTGGTHADLPGPGHALYSNIDCEGVTGLTYVHVCYHTLRACLPLGCMRGCCKRRGERKLFSRYAEQWPTATFV